MGHHHGHDHSVGNIKVAFVLNLVFAIIEIVGGILTNSLAILSDALHDLGDSLSLGMSWYFQKLSRKGRSDKYSYGYKRFSLLGAVINAIVLSVGSIFILINAIPEILEPGETDAKGMMYLAILGVLVNGAAVFKLRKGESLNEKLVSLHLLEDVLGWVAVLVGSLVMLFFEAPFIDPLLSVMIAVFVLYNAYKGLKKSLKIILQGVPDEVSIEEVCEELKSIKEISGVHNCHIWSMDGQDHVMTTHLRVGEDLSLSDQVVIKHKIRDILKEKQITHFTIEFESEVENRE